MWVWVGCAIRGKPHGAVAEPTKFINFEDLGIKMENINRFGRNLKGIILLILLLAGITTEAFCVVHNSTQNSDIDLEVAEDKQVKIYESLISEIHDLKADLKETKREIDNRFAYQMQCNEEAINSVNTSISGATLALTIVGIIVIVGGIVLGFYITLVERKVRNLTNENKSILETHIKIKDDVEKLDSHIKRNMAQLYDDLKKEETKVYVQRLVKVPKDIVNLADILTSRDIPIEFFPKLKEAYKSLSEETSEDPKLYETAYRMLFFQHFPSVAIFDNELQDGIEKAYSGLMRSSFENDIIKTSREFIMVCIDGDILDYREKIKKYFTALGKSRYAEYKELHREIYRTLSTKENRFNLYSILRSEEELKEISKIYGQHMLTDYKGASGNTESEEKVLQEIAKESEQEGDTQE